MKSLCTLVILTCLIATCLAQGEHASLIIRGNTGYKPIQVIKFSNLSALDLKTGTVVPGSYRFNGKFTLHQAATHTYMHLPKLTFFKGTLPIRTGSIKFTQGIQLDKQNFLYFNLAFGGK